MLSSFFSKITPPSFSSFSASSPRAIVFYVSIICLLSFSLGSYLRTASTTDFIFFSSSSSSSSSLYQAQIQKKGFSSLRSKDSRPLQIRSVCDRYTSQAPSLWTSASSALQKWTRDATLSQHCHLYATDLLATKLLTSAKSRSLHSSSSSFSSDSSARDKNCLAAESQFVADFDSFMSSDSQTESGMCAFRALMSARSEFAEKRDAKRLKGGKKSMKKNNDNKKKKNSDEDDTIRETSLRNTKKSTKKKELDRDVVEDESPDRKRKRIEKEKKRLREEIENKKKQIMQTRKEWEKERSKRLSKRMKEKQNKMKQKEQTRRRGKYRGKGRRIMVTVALRYPPSHIYLRVLLLRFLQFADPKRDELHIFIDRQFDLWKKLLAVVKNHLKSKRNIGHDGFANVVFVQTNKWKNFHEAQKKQLLEKQQQEGAPGAGGGGGEAAAAGGGGGEDLAKKYPHSVRVNMLHYYFSTVLYEQQENAMFWSRASKQVDLIIACDSRDVVIQKNPFDALEEYFLLKTRKVGKKERSSRAKIVKNDPKKKKDQSAEREEEERKEEEDKQSDDIDHNEKKDKKDGLFVLKQRLRKLEQREEKDEKERRLELQREEEEQQREEEDEEEETEEEENNSNEYLFTTTEEPNTIVDNGVNREWIESVIGSKGFELLGRYQQSASSPSSSSSENNDEDNNSPASNNDESSSSSSFSPSRLLPDGKLFPILCSGLYAGTFEAMRDFHSLFAKMITCAPPTSKGVDQGVFNTLVYAGLSVAGFDHQVLLLDQKISPFRNALLNLTQFAQDDDNSKDADLEGKKGNGFFLNCLGERFAIVHQLDRHREFWSKVVEKEPASIPIGF